MRKRTLLVAAAFAAGSAVLTAGAGPIFEVVDISGVESRNGLGDGANVVLLINLAPNAEVVGFDWELFYTPRAPSWTDEPNMRFSDTGQTSNYNWDMGDWGGVSNSDPIALAGSDVFSIMLGADGVLRLEFWEDFVDYNGRDGTYSNSVLVISYIPAPSCLALLGLAGLVGTRRRRS